MELGNGSNTWLITLTVIVAILFYRKGKIESIYISPRIFTSVCNFIHTENSIKRTYHIGGMSYGGCVDSVQQKLSAVAGITFVKVDLANKQAQVTSSEEIETDILRKALNNTHYTISEL